MSTTIHSADPDTLTNASGPRKGKAAKEAALEAVGSARDKVVETSEDARDAARDVARDARDSMTRATATAREVTREQPLLAVVGALAVGVAIGMAINNRR